MDLPLQATESVIPLFKGFNVANHNREELGERGPSLISSVDALINFTTRFRVEQLSQPCQYRVQYLDIFPPVCDREDCGLIGSAINTQVRPPLVSGWRQSAPVSGPEFV